MVFPNADVVIRAPLPHVNIDETSVQKSESQFMDNGEVLTYSAVHPYPVALSWVEIAFNAAVFMGGAAASHYAEHVFDAIDGFLLDRIKIINLVLLRKKHHTVIDLDRENRAEAIAKIMRALDNMNDEKAEQ